MSNQMRFPNNPANRTEILLNDNITQLTKLANCVDTGTNLVKVDIEDATISVEGTNLATKENQQTMIDKSIRGINNTGSIGDGSENATAVCLGYDRGNGKARALLVDGNGAMINDPSKEGLVVANGTTTALHSMMLGNSDGTNLRTVKVDADGHLQVDVLSGAGGGDASAANQTTMITKLGEIDTAQDLTNSKLDTIAGDTTSIDGKITACNTGAVVVSSGSITESNSSAIKTDIASIDSKITACNTGAVVVSSGAITETNSSAILADTASIDGKITACNTGAVVVSSGAITETNSSAILADTASIDGKITACNTGAVVVSSGSITESNSSAIKTDIASIDGKITACNTGAVVVSSGAITETNSSAILADTASIDGKITACNTGAVVISSGTISLPAGASTEAKQTDIDNAIDTMSAKLPASLGQKANASSLSICRSSTAGAFDVSARTTIGTASTSTKLLCDSAGRLAVNNGLQTSLLECHQTGTSSTTITIADGSNSATKNITLNDIRMAQLTPDVIGYRIENGGTGGSGTDVNMEVSFDGTNYVEILTNLVGLAKSNYIGNLGDDAVGLPTLAQAFRFKISNNSGGSADYKVSLIAYGLDFAQA